MSNPQSIESLFGKEELIENNPHFNKEFYLKGLVQEDDNVDVHVGSVTFLPGCRNNWHIHHDGYQLLLVTNGTGWYQEEGRTPQLLNKGDVVVIHEGIKHWHGATSNTKFTHLAITKGTTQWCEEVSDEQYNAL